MSDEGSNPQPASCTHPLLTRVSATAGSSALLLPLDAENRATSDVAELCSRPVSNPHTSSRDVSTLVLPLTCRM